MRAELEAFLTLLPADVILVLDEAYIEFVRDPAGPDSLDYVRADARWWVADVFQSLRAGRLADRLRDHARGGGRDPEPGAATVQRQPAGPAAAAAALDDVEFLEETLRVVHRGVDYLQRALAELGLECLPTQSNFLMVGGLGEARQVYEGLLDRGVIVRPLASYGFPDASA